MGTHHAGTRHHVIGRIAFVVVAVLAFGIDRVTKLMIDAELVLGERVGVVGDVFELRYVRNTGIAFGLLADRGPLVLAGSLIVGVLLFVFLLRVHPDDLLTIIGGALVTGGALGNLYDRIQYRYVIDFLHFPQIPAFKVFNVADICISVGVVLIVIGQVRDIRRSEREAVPVSEQTSSPTTEETP